MITDLPGKALLKLPAAMLLAAFVVGCGGGGGGGGGSGSGGGTGGGGGGTGGVVTGTAGTGGSISPTTQTVAAGATHQLTVTPDAGFGIDGVTGCGGQLAGNTFTTGAISANCEVVASFVFTLAPPADVTAAASDSAVTLSWSDVSDATSFNIYRATSDGINPDTAASYDVADEGVTSPFTVTGLENDTAYFFVVTSAVDGAESAASSEVSATPEAGSLTKLDAEGNALPVSAEAWECVRDDRVGLVWEVKTDDGLRDVGGTYSWHDPNAETNGGNAGLMNGGVCAGSECDTTQFVEAVNTAGMCGTNQWRKPSIDALASLRVCSNLEVNPPARGASCGDSASFGVPTLDAAFFPNTAAARYWSSSTSGDDAGQAWFVDFGTGIDARAAKTEPNRLRLVTTDTEYLVSRFPGQSTASVLRDNGTIEEGSSFQFVVSNNSGETFVVERFRFLNGEEVIEDVTSGPISPGVNNNFLIVLSQNIQDNGQSALLQIARPELGIRFEVVIEVNLPD